MIHDLIKYAKQLDSMLCVDYDKERNLYKIWLHMVGIRDKYLHSKLEAHGFTIEDACCDYLRKARTGTLVHYINDTTLKVS